MPCSRTDRGFTLMASDTPAGMEHNPGNNIAGSLSDDEARRASRLLVSLCDGGTATMPLETQIWRMSSARSFAEHNLADWARGRRQADPRPRSPRLHLFHRGPSALLRRGLRRHRGRARLDLVTGLIKEGRLALTTPIARPTTTPVASRGSRASTSGRGSAGRARRTVTRPDGRPRSWWPSTCRRCRRA